MIKPNGSARSIAIKDNNPQGPLAGPTVMEENNSPMPVSRVHPSG